MQKKSYEKRLTVNQFNEVDARLGGQDRVKKMAYSVLVEGKSAHDTGVALGVTRQAAHRAAKRYYDAFLKQHKCPKGWSLITVALPPKLAEKVCSMSLNQLEKYCGG